MQTRRTFLNMAAVAVVSAARPAQTWAQSKKIVLRIGHVPLSGHLPMVIAMREEKLLEKHAAAFGYQATPEWTPFVTGPPANEAFIAGQLDVDMHFGSTMMALRVNNRVPFLVLGVDASHLSNAVLVRPGGGVDDIPKLQGKTIGLPVGTTAHYMLSSVIAYHLGKTLAEANIKIVNMPPADAVKMPSGIDAAAVWVPFKYMGDSLGTGHVLIDAEGFTGRGHRTPNVRLPEVSKAWGYPEGYLVDRTYLTVREALFKEHPKLALAYLLARWEAQDLVTSRFDYFVEKANEVWHMPPHIAKLAARTYPEQSNIRNAPVVLESDALAIMKTSEFYVNLGSMDQAISWNKLAPFVSRTADVQRQAWELRHSQPPVSQMEKGFHGTVPEIPEIIVNGGRPIWLLPDTPDWATRLYKPGPFPITR